MNISVSGRASPLSSPRHRSSEFGKQTFDVTGNDSIHGSPAQERRGQGVLHMQRHASVSELKQDADRFEKNRSSFRSPVRYDQGAGMTSADVRAKVHRSIKKIPSTSPARTTLMGPVNPAAYPGT
jgi:hypothetical protein